MKKSNKKNQDIVSGEGIEGRLEALIALTVGVLHSIAKDPKSKQVTGAEDKAIVALFAVGMPQIEIGKLLGVNTRRVNDICKKLKNK